MLDNNRQFNLQTKNVGVGRDKSGNKEGEVQARPIRKAFYLHVLIQDIVTQILYWTLSIILNILKAHSFYEASSTSATVLSGWKDGKILLNWPN
jgi:hypothetical protein